MSADENRSTIRRLYDALFERDYERIADLVAPDTIFNGQAIGVAGYMQLVLLPRTSFPDFQNTPQEYLAEGDKVAVRWIAGGTHLAPLRELPPTGRRAKFGGIDIFRLVEGKIAESWEVVDRMSMMQQLGVIPGPTAADESDSFPGEARARTGGRSEPTENNKAWCAGSMTGPVGAIRRSWTHL